MPPDKSYKIKIVFICDNNYALPTVVAVTSLLQNKRNGTFYDVFILGVEIDDETEIKLLSLNNNDMHITVIRVENNFTDISIDGHVTTSALFKFMIQDIFIDQNKIIYLDSDIIIQDDLSKLYNLDISDHYAAVVRDLPCEKTNRHKLFNLDYYFNTGVMLLNLQKLRIDHMSGKMVTMKKNHPEYRFMDQDVFNKVFNNKIILLNYKYNYFSFLKQKKYDYTVAEFFGEEVRDVAVNRKKPAITHYTSSKPWLETCIYNRSLWLKYFNQSPYKETKLPVDKNVFRRIKFITGTFIKNIIFFKKGIIMK